MPTYWCGNNMTDQGAPLGSPTLPAGLQASHFQRLPLELLQSVLQGVPRTDWPAARLVSHCFLASLAPLITTITIRQWGSACSTSRSRMTVGRSSSLNHVRHLQAVIDSADDLQQLLGLLAQLKQVTRLTLKGLKPLEGLTQLLFPTQQPYVGGRTISRSVSNGGRGGSSSFPAAAAVEALARLTALELPDSNSSSLPKGVQLPNLTRVTLFSVDSLQGLAALAPNLQQLQCFSLTLTPGSLMPGPSRQGASAPAAAAAPAAVGVLACCRVLAAACIRVPPGCRVKAAAACLASAMPDLGELVMLPELVLHVQQAGDASTAAAQQPCEGLTLRDLQHALPGLQLVHTCTAAS